MPNKPINYENSVIYKICCKNPEIKYCYVGSTTNLRMRKNRHKSNCNKEDNPQYNLKVYKFIRDNDGWNNWEIIQLEKPIINEKNELKAKEREWFEKLGATLNMVVPNRSRQEKDKERYINNKEYWRESRRPYRLQYYKKNKDKLNKKVECPNCKSIVGKQYLTTHQKTPKCISVSS